MKLELLQNWLRRLLFIPGRALWLNGGDFLGYFAFGAGNGGFLKIRNSDCFFR